MEGNKPGIPNTQPKHLKLTFFAEVYQLNWSFVTEDAFHLMLMISNSFVDTNIRHSVQA